MEEKVLIIEGEELQYVVDIDDNTMVMRHSKSEIWSSHVQGVGVGRLKDTGNGININMDNFKLKLDYSEFCELFRLMELKVLNDGDRLMDETIYTKID